MVAALALTETVSFGVLFYAFTVFVEPMRADLGWSTATISGAFSVGLVAAGLMAPLVGRWVDRHGTRGLMTLGSLAAAAGVAMWSQVASPIALYLVWLWLGIASAMVLYEPAFALIAVWFERRRSAALTLLTFVAGFASVIFIPLAALLVERLGWREALLVLAGLLLVVTVPPHAWLLRRSPADVGQEVDGGPPPGDTPPRRAPAPSMDAVEAFATATFARLTFAFSVSMAVIMALGVHLVPLLTRRGLDPLEAAAAVGAIGLVALPGRLVFTPLGSVAPRGLVTAAIFATQALGVMALLLVDAAWGVWAFVALYGAGFGAITPARAALVAEAFGARAYGAIAGRMMLVGTAARAAAPLAFGALVSVGLPDAVGLVLALALLLAAAVAVAPVGRTRHRRDADPTALR
jgi:MFS family permease